MPSDEETHEYIVVHDAHSRLDTNSPRTPNANGRASGDGDQNSTGLRKNAGRPGDALDRLRAMPILREIPYYEGKELPPEKSVESGRVQTRGASLLAMRGEVKDPPCSHCATGVGRFSQCIAHEDWFHGACATCQLGTRGNLCTYRRKEKQRFKPEDNSNEPESEDLNSMPRKDTPPIIEPAVEPTAQSQELSASGTPNIEGTATASTTGPASKKRKRETLQATTVWKQYVSPYLPAMPSGSIQTTLNGTTPILYSTPQSNNLQSPYQSTPPLHANTSPVNYIYQKENTQESAKPPHALSPKTVAKVTVVPPTKTFATHRAESAIRRRDRRDRRDSRRSKGSNVRDRDATESLSPSVQLLQPYYSAPEEPPVVPIPEPAPKKQVKSRAPKPKAQGLVAINAQPKTIELPDPPLINTLPRKKQKQIYGIIGGLQSGIRSCKQQAENMQKQLDLLQAALGIDAEDDNDVSIIE